MQLLMPVKWFETRRENVQATFHGRGQVGYIEVGVKNDGTLTGLRYNVFADLGAYHQLLTPAIPTLTGLMLSGSYKIPAIQMNVTGVFTNKMATDAYRGAGRPEATYVVERAMDIVAAELGLGAVEVRRKNFPAPSEFPFKTATGLFYDSGDYEAALARALEMSDYQELREEQKRARDDGRIVGVGVSSYVEICALGPSQAMPACGRLGERDRENRAYGQSDGLDRRVAARAGAGDIFCADRCRPARSRARRHNGHSRRHINRSIRHRHLRQPRYGCRRHGGVLRRRKAPGKSAEDSRAYARCRSIKRRIPGRQVFERGGPRRFCGG
jgi:hypothetical protein